ncbi:MAG: MFS transporter [Rhizobiales bacterium]|nr:MFS transporter [Hyphomicrobiales bacterium]
MTAVEARVAEATDDQLARRNAIILAVTMALAGANNIVIVATGAIAGAMLAPDKTLATLPVSIYVLGLWFGTLPIGWLARHYGRRTSFQAGTLCGVIAGLVCCLGVLLGSFLIFNVGAFFSGLYAAAQQAYRFAAADTASEQFRPKAISWVLVGGIFAAVLGPQLIIATKDLWQPYLFAATYIGQAVFAVLSAAVLALLKIPKPKPLAAHARGRTLGEILRQPRFVVAVACGVASYAMMNMVMTSAPLAMVECKHSVADATLGMQWHVLGMFVPSLFTGSLIARFGVERIVVLGFALILASAVIGMSGLTLWHFWSALILLGVGWNFGFIGASALVTQCHRPEERTRVQSFNDFLVFGSMAIGSFSSGILLTLFGWETVNAVVVPVVLTAAVLLILLTLRKSAREV